MAEEKVSNTDALKALVQSALDSGTVHPDQRVKLEAWQDATLTDAEKDDRLTDDAYVEKYGKTRAQAAADREASGGAPAATVPATPTPEGDDDKGSATDEPSADEGAKPRSGSRK